MKKERKYLVGDLVGVLGKLAPYDFAEEWDNVGLLAGDATEQVTGVVVAVNLGPEALEAARSSDANVIVCHHPPIFKPISRLTNGAQPYLYQAVRAGISVIALHTNFDLSSEKLSATLVKKLGFEFSKFLASRGGRETPRSIKLGKFITYIPEKDLERVRQAVCDAGAGNIGNYSHCSFSWDGMGTFRGNQDSHPKVGKAGRLEQTAEKRLEIVFPLNLREKIISSARKAHPYDEMAFDIIELAQPERSIGYGFIGDTAPDQSTNLVFHKLIDNVKETFSLREVSVVGPGLSDSKMRVKRIAFSPGAGSSFVTAAVAAGADVYICGEVGYHQMLEARQKGLTLIMLGHSYSERFFIETVAEWCDSVMKKRVIKIFEKIHATV